MVRSNPFRRFDPMKNSDWLPLLQSLADQADAVATRYFRSGDLHVRAKIDRTIVTQADVEIESVVRDTLAKRSPELSVFGEEHGEDARKTEARLIIDPIDGTVNFARGIPVFGTLLAIEVGETIVAGLVSAPALHQRWHAAAGAGAWSGTRQLRVSEIASLASAQAFHGSLAGSEAVGATARIPALLAKTVRQRGFGDFYQHVLVAEGAGEIAIDPVVHPWDIA